MCKVIGKYAPTSPLSMAPSGVLSSLDPDVQIEEDETSVRLMVEMNGVRGKDIEVAVQGNVLSVTGYRSIGPSEALHQSQLDEDESYQRPSRRVMKRQRICRRLAVDTTQVEVDRAVASIWNGHLVFYAPKKRIPSSSTTFDFEFSSPAADQLWRAEQASARKPTMAASC